MTYSYNSFCILSDVQLSYKCRVCFLSLFLKCSFSLKVIYQIDSIELAYNLCSEIYFHKSWPTC